MSSGATVPLYDHDTISAPLCIVVCLAVCISSDSFANFVPCREWRTLSTHWSARFDSTNYGSWTHQTRADKTAWAAAAWCLDEGVCVCVRQPAVCCSVNLCRSLSTRISWSTQDFFFSPSQEKFIYNLTCWTLFGGASSQKYALQEENIWELCRHRAQGPRNRCQKPEMSSREARGWYQPL